MSFQPLAEDCIIDSLTQLQADSLYMLAKLKCGPGIDGDVALNGTNVYTSIGINKSGNIYTMTRDCYFNSLSVNSPVTLKSASYKIYIRGILNNYGFITNSGANTYSSPYFGTGGAGIAGLLSGTLGTSGASTAGPNGITTNGSTASAPLAPAVSMGNSGGGGGAGGTSGMYTGGLATAGTVRNFRPVLSDTPTLLYSTSMVSGGVGGRGGSSGAGLGTDGGGGGGGQGGGGLYLVAFEYNNYGRISSDGGNGGTGDNAPM